MHWPTTVIIAMPSAMPGITCKEARLPATAFAVMEMVPKPETMLATKILPIWKMLFSRPFGTPICKMLFNMERWISGLWSLS